MNSKIFKNLLVAIFSLSMISTANAGLIVGDLYADEDGIQWEYVGYYDLAAGPETTTGTGSAATYSALPYNGIEAAIFHFGILINNQEYALSSNVLEDYANYNEYIVNYKAWYDAFDGFVGIHEAGQSVQANNAGNANIYDAVGDISAFIHDRAPNESEREVDDEFYFNYVFKSVDVPEPSTLAIFSLALVGLSLRRKRNK